MHHYSVDIEYDEQNDEHHLTVKPLTGIPDDKKSGRESEPFNSDDYPELAWLKGFRIAGYPDVIKLPFRIPPFQLEYVPARIEWYENGHFTCTVLCQPEMDCNINQGDTIEVVTLADRATSRSSINVIGLFPRKILISAWDLSRAPSSESIATVLMASDGTVEI